MTRRCNARLALMLALLLLLLVTVAPGWAGTWSLDVKDTTLTNGMRVLIVERHNVPLISCQMWVNVGSVNDALGATGIAHLHEHLMFKGTRRVGTRSYKDEVPLMEREDELAAMIDRELGKGARAGSRQIRKWREEVTELENKQREYIVPSQFDAYYSSAGASGTNAMTGPDSTTYVVTIPSNKLELFMWMESDRFAGPVFREFYSERDVVTEERKQTVEDDPAGAYDELLAEMVYPETPYGFEIGGRMSDVTRVTRPEAYAFFGRYYVPNNMCMIMVGDVKAEDAFRLAERYFGRIKRAADPPPLRPTERLNIGQRRIEMKAKARPAVDIAFTGTTFGSKDDAVFDVISGILSGDSGRLYKDLVIDKHIALNVGGGNDARKIAGSFLFRATPAPTATHQQVENALWAQAEKLKIEPVDQHELDKIKKQVRAGVIRSVVSSDTLAYMLGNYWVFTGDWHSLVEYIEKVAAVTADDVMRVADKYFNKDNSTVGWLVQEEGGISQWERELYESF